MEVERPKQADYYPPEGEGVERSEWRQTEGGWWYRPLFVWCFAVVLIGSLLLEAGAGAVVDAAGIVLGVVFVGVFLRWLARRFVRRDEPPLTWTEELRACDSQSVGK